MLEDEAEELAARADAPVVALVTDALRVEERLVKLERGVPQVVGECRREIHLCKHTATGATN